MAKAYFGLSIGQAGCIPDSYFGAYGINTRRELTQAFADAVDFYGLPKAVLRDVSFKRLWDHAKRHGLSVVHHEYASPSMACVLNLHGMTEAEYEAWLDAED